MGLFDAVGITIILKFFWPIIVAVPVLYYCFRMVGNMAARSVYESSEIQKTRLTFIRRAFWTGMIIVVLCVIAYYLPAIKDHFEAAGEAISEAKNAVIE
ncbi:MAG: hypothetical protein HOD85_33485 [Deltaproteobacteria bacterium]|jgi:hypothetical protein|nr:hypothetical protein [Deltaproteobacteria bacterium]MBT4639441.1 hypothetical protein [Deltaproteobacteria bacterium]